MDFNEFLVKDFYQKEQDQMQQMRDYNMHICHEDCYRFLKESIISLFENGYCNDAGSSRGLIAFHLKTDDFSKLNADEVKDVNYLVSNALGIDFNLGITTSQNTKRSPKFEEFWSKALNNLEKELGHYNELLDRIKYNFNEKLRSHGFLPKSEENYAKQTMSEIITKILLDK